MKMVKSLLKDVVETVMMEKVSIQNESELDDQDDEVEGELEDQDVEAEGELEDQDDEISPYLQARNERVAEIQAEFRRRYPEFGQDVRDLGISRKRKQGGPKFHMREPMARESI